MEPWARRIFEDKIQQNRRKTRNIKVFLQR
jgi:hypothetical protein